MYAKKKKTVETFKGISEMTENSDQIPSQKSFNDYWFKREKKKNQASCSNSNNLNTI